MTATDAIALCRAERSKRAGRVSAQLEEVRAIVARLESQDEQARNGGRRRGSTAGQSKAVVAKEPRPVPTTFRCGHPRTPENSYFHKSPGRPGYQECKTCTKARNAKRDRTGEGAARALSGPVGLNADRSAYHAEYYQKHREKRIAQVIASQRRRQAEKSLQARQRKSPRRYASGSDIKLSDDISRP